MNYQIWNYQNCQIIKLKNLLHEMVSENILCACRHRCSSERIRVNKCFWQVQLTEKRIFVIKSCFWISNSPVVIRFIIHSSELLSITQLITYLLQPRYFWKLVLLEVRYMWEAEHITLNFLKAAFHKFYLVNSWILCPILE